MASWLLAAALALSPPPLPQDAPLDPAMPAPEQVMALPPELRERFRRWNASAPASQVVRMERLVDFMFDRDGGLGLEYQQDANYTVAQTFQTRRANCLSFTLVVIALARDAGMEAYAQEIEDVLTWYQEGSTVYRNNHVNAGIRIGGQRFTVDVAWDEVIARQQPKAIPDRHLLAMFYNNRAIGLFSAGRIEPAEAYMQRAIELDPAYPAFWNNAGVLALRRGDLALAERDYLHALSMDQRHSSALFNLVSLYGRSGRDAEARPLQRRLERIRARDPFDQFLLALECERAGDYAGAVGHYQRAIRLHGSEHRFYLGLARAYLHLGDARRAGRALARAQALSEGATRARYQAKLEKLRREREPSLFGPRPR